MRGKINLCCEHGVPLIPILKGKGFSFVPELEYKSEKAMAPYSSSCLENPEAGAWWAAVWQAHSWTEPKAT